MDTKKFLVGGIIGGVANFLLGWLVWGILLMSFMQKHSNPTSAVIFRSESEMIWWTLIAGNLALGFLVCYILLRSGVRSAASGASTGAMVGLLMAAAMDCIMYSQMKIYGLTAIAVDIIAATVVTAIVGAVVGWYLGRDNSAS